MWPTGSKVSMDYFHMLKAVAMQHSLLIQRHLQTAIHEIRRLADVPHDSTCGQSKLCSVSRSHEVPDGQSSGNTLRSTSSIDSPVGGESTWVRGLRVPPEGVRGGGRQCTKCWEAGTVLRKPWSALSTLF